MGEREALYRAVVENPSDDAPRLVFADWLEEHGEPERAAFIRAQIRAECLRAQIRVEWPREQIWVIRDDANKEQARALSARAEKLARGRKRSWKNELPKIDGVSWGDFSRGFVGNVRFRNLDCSSLCLGQVVAAAPVTSIAFNPHRSGEAVSLRRFSASVHLSRITALCLEMLGLVDDAIVPLTESRHLGRLGYLSLDSNQLTGRGVTVLAGSAAFPSLRAIRLTRNPIGPDAVPPLLESPWVRNLRALTIDEGPLGPHATATLGAALHPRVWFAEYR